mgnify:CR=1 FL=1
MDDRFLQPAYRRLFPREWEKGGTEHHIVAGTVLYNLLNVAGHLPILLLGAPGILIVLLDDRFLQPAYRRLFPREWENYDIVTVNSVAERVKYFWRQWT